MLSPDSYLGKPLETQGYNRYTYAHNNPLSYVDPDGNIPFLIIAFVAVSAFLKGMQYDMSGKGTFLEGFFKGAVIGAAGGYLASLAPIGILPGLAYGTGSGALIGAASAALDGNDIWKGVLTGGITGGIVGAVSGGLEADQLGANVWTGHRPPMYYEVTGCYANTGGEGAPYNDKYLHDLYNKNYPGTKGVSWMTMEKVSKRTVLNSDGTFGVMVNGKMAKAMAVTEPRTWAHGRTCRIFFSKSAFESKERLAEVLAHELGHVTYYYMGDEMFSLSQERVYGAEPGYDTQGHIAINSMAWTLATKNGWHALEAEFAEHYLTISAADDYLLKPLNFLIKKIVFP